MCPFGDKSSTCRCPILRHTMCHATVEGMTSTLAPPLDFATRLRAARDNKDMRLDDAAYLARQILPPTMPISRETIRRYETGRVAEHEANPLYIAALAVVYGVRTADLSERASEGIASIFGVLVHLNPDLAAAVSAQEEGRDSAFTIWYAGPDPPDSARFSSHVA